MGGHAEGIRKVGESDNLGNTQGAQQTPLGRNQRKNYPCLSARIVLSVGDGDKGGISRVLVGLKVLFGVVT